MSLPITCKTHHITAPPNFQPDLQRSSATITTTTTPHTPTIQSGIILPPNSLHNLDTPPPTPPSPSQAPFPHGPNSLQSYFGPPHHHHHHPHAHHPVRHHFLTQRSSYFGHPFPHTLHPHHPIRLHSLTQLSSYFRPPPPPPPAWLVLISQHLSIIVFPPGFFRSYLQKCTT